MGALKQRIKGKIQQAKGDIQEVTGNKGGATISRIKGKANETIGNLRLDLEKNRLKNR